MLVRDFSGGMNERISPMLLPLNQAVLLENVDVDSGKLVPIKDKVFAFNGKPFSFMSIDGTLYGDDTDITYIEYKNIIYTSKGTKVKSGIESKVGITAPTSSPNVTNTKAFTSSQSPIIELVTDDETAEAIKKTISISVAMYNSKDDMLGSLLSSEKLKEAYKVKITNITQMFSSAPSGFDKMKIFYSLNGLLGNENSFYTSTIDNTTTEFEFSLANVNISDETYEYMQGKFTYVYTYYNSSDGVESAPSPISTKALFTVNLTDLQNTSEDYDLLRIYRSGSNINKFNLVDEIPKGSTEYLDNNSTLSIAGKHILDSFNNLPMSTKGKYLTETNGMLFLAQGDKLIFSDNGKPYAWGALNFLDFDSDIMGIGNIQNGIIVFTLRSTYIVTGTSPLSLSKYLLSDEQGCINHHTIEYVDKGLVWVSEDGVCYTNGGTVKCISRGFLGKKTFGTKNATSHDNVYYLTYSGDKTLVIDFNYGEKYKYYTLDIDRVENFNDKLYGYKDGAWYELFKGNNLELHYISPLYSGNSTNNKMLKDFYFYSKDFADIIIYADREEINNFRFKGHNHIQLTSVEAYEVQVEIKSFDEVYEFNLPMKGTYDKR